MKWALFLATATLLVAACERSAAQSAHGGQHVQQRPVADTNAVALSDLFTLKDAERIVGEPARLTDSSTTGDADVARFQCAYTAVADDAGTKRTGAVYFLVEAYGQVSSAQHKYTFIKTANESHEGIQVLDDVGDEAYFHSDGENFYFIMVRKGATVFNMKVNKITSRTSLDEFHATARRITAAL